MTPYPEYKATGLQWLPKIPEHWKIQKIRELFIERSQKVSDKDFSPLSVSKGGIVPQIATVAKTDNGDNRKRVKIGDFVINSRSDRKGSSGISTYDGSVSLINIVLKPRANGNGRFVHYLLKSLPFIEEYYRNGRGIVADLWTTRYSEMKSISLPSPSAEEQAQIVRYLDAMTAKINKLIRAKKKQIALLQEQKQAIINQAVTQGLDPNVKMKDSGNKWIGRVPHNWRLLKNSIIFRESIEKSEIGKEELLSVSRHYGIRRHRDIKDGERAATLKPAESLVGYKIVRKFQLVMNIMRARNGSFGISPFDGIVSSAYCVYSLKVKCNPMYLHYFLKSPQMIHCFEAFSHGIAEHRRRLYPSAFLQLSSILPPLQDQNNIVCYIEHEVKKMDCAIEGIKHEIELIGEYQASQISNIVTGKIDIRNLVVEDVNQEDLAIDDAETAEDTEEENPEEESED